MISVVMATYNGARYIEEQLKSIYDQTCKVDEIVITDDCSTDETVTVLRKFMEKYPDCNIRFYQNEENLGYKKNFRKAMSLCRGDIIFLCDQDDIWMDKKVEVLHELMEKQPEIGAVSSAFIRMDGDEKKGKCEKVYQRKMKEASLARVPLEDLVFHNISQGCSMGIRREVLEAFLENFSEELPHDWQINVIAAMQKKCYFLNSPLFYYRIHEYNTIGLNDELTLKRKNSYEIRANDALMSIRVVNFIQRLDELFYIENRWLKNLKEFSVKHVEYLGQKKFLGIIAQNFNSNYRRLKTFRGRLLDLFYCIK